jgi:hypothetical protein
MQLNSDSLVSRTGGLMSTPIGPELIILNLAKNHYVGLDEIGRRIWDLLSAPVSVKALCLQVVGEYQGNSQEITADVMALLSELSADGLIEHKCTDTPVFP